MHEILLSTSVEELDLFLESLLDLECWGVSITYGGALTLDFGGEFVLQIGDTKMEFGEWRLDTRNSSFRLLRNGDVIYSIDTDVDIVESDMEYLGQLEGEFIEKVEVLNDFSLRILFSSGHLLHLSCDVFEEDKADPGWEIDNFERRMVLEVNPDRWSYRTFANRRCRLSRRE